MRDLLTDPVWRAEDLGHPIPDLRHACSVGLPLWDHVVGYEEGRADVLERLHCGYPRFIIHDEIRRLLGHCTREYAAAGESCQVLPSAQTAERCIAFLRDHGNVAAAVHDTGRCGVHAVTYPAPAQESAFLFWRRTGEIISSRRAEAFFGHGTPGDAEGGAEDRARQAVRRRIAEWTGQHEDDVYLFPTGMAAVFGVHRMLCRMFPGRRCAQFDFPYVDVLKVQREWGPGVHFFPRPGRESREALRAVVKRERLSGIFCELASNPLLRFPDMHEIARLAREHEIPVVADDTIAGSVNIDACRAADIVTTSLTKYFSGTTDVMGGSVVLNRNSPFHTPFKRCLADLYEDLLWSEDAVVLERNSRDYPERMQRINRTGERLAEWFAERPEVGAVHYPKLKDREAFDALSRPGGGYAGMLSLDLRDAATAAPRFYDHLRVSKGPSLGANFTLACPYPLLAHYKELDWAESCGVSRYLVRISFGLEEAEDLMARCEEALRHTH